MAWAGIKMILHDANLSLTDVNVDSVTQVIYDSSDLTTPIALPYAMDAGTDPTVYLDQSVSGQAVQVVAVQSDDSALIDVVQTSQHVVVEADLAPTLNQIAYDTDRIDVAVQDLDDELTAVIGTKVSLVGEDDFYVTTSSAGLILTSPDGTQWRLGVSDLGEVTTDEVTP